MKYVFIYPKYYTPSVLGFYESQRGPNPPNLLMKIPTAHTEESFEWEATEAIWHDGKWKLFFWDNDIIWAR